MAASLQSGNRASGLNEVNVLRTTRQYEWVIEKFSELPSRKLKSATFSGPNDDGVKWLLHMYNNVDGANKGYLSLYLMLTPSAINAQKVVSLKVKIFSSSKWWPPVSAKFFDAKVDSTKGWGWSKLIKRKLLLKKSNGYLNNDTLRIFFELSTNETPDRCDADDAAEANTALLANQEELLMTSEGEYNDCVLVCKDDVTVHTSKTFLAAQSAVFRAMLRPNSGFQEAQTGRITVGDYNSVVMTEVCRFASCGRVENIEELVEELVAAADQYDLPELKQLCVKRMCSTIAKENVSRRLVIADLYNLAPLKQAVFNFIKSNGLDLTDYKQLVTTAHHQNLLFELIGALSLQK
uniref:Uncharacterized protein n=1 Tax=Plectus sambesii TaxID=2011161 RepID=A0A914VS43_9BILA